jgi:chromosome partitioning protein
MKTIAFVAEKGGVTKTSCAVNLAHGLAVAGKRTLIVDLDRQSATTNIFGGHQTCATVIEAMTGRAGISDAAREVRPGLWLLPAHRQLNEVSDQMVKAGGMASVIRDMLSRPDELTSQLDYVVIDTKADASHALTTAALVAAQGYIVPVNSTSLALESVPLTVGSVNELRDTRLESAQGPTAQLLGVLLTMTRKTGSASTIAEEARAVRAFKTFKAEIRHSARWDRQVMLSQTAFDSKGNLRSDFEALVKEVISRCRKLT